MDTFFSFILISYIVSIPYNSSFIRFSKSLMSFKIDTFMLNRVGRFIVIFCITNFIQLYLLLFFGQGPSKDTVEWSPVSASNRFESCLMHNLDPKNEQLKGNFYFSFYIEEMGGQLYKNVYFEVHKFLCFDTKDKIYNLYQL